MQASSAYDFEHFSDKIEKQTAITVLEIERETVDYVLQKEHETEQSIKLWLKQSQDLWDQEKERQKKVNHHSVDAQMYAEWSVFIKERRSALRIILKTRIENIFPSLAECFITTIIKKYQQGTFTMPKRFNPTVDQEGFIVKSSEKDKIIFTSGNLFIEYSVERILEELEDELSSHFHMDDKKWQV